MSGRWRELVRAWARLAWRARELPVRVRRELGAFHRLTEQMDALEARVAKVACDLEALPAIGGGVETLARDSAEHALVLESAVRSMRQAEAEAELRKRLPSVDEREDGLSVLIPCWNHAGFLAAAVASARAAIDAIAGRGEILILDDGSRDESRDVARAELRRDSRVRVIESDENLGLVRARNVQLAQSRFRHAILLDADNQLLPDGVAVLYESACRTRAVLSYGCLVVVDDAGEFVRLLSSEPVGPELFVTNWIDTLSLVDVDAVISAGGFDGDVHGHQDWELVLRLARLHLPILFVPTVVGRYRAARLSMTGEASTARRVQRVRRMHAASGIPAASDLCIAIDHPTAPALWRNPAWSSGDAAATAAPSRAAEGPRILVVSSAGVRNGGDDAILLATLERLQRIHPGSVPVVISDGDVVPPIGSLGVWSGTTEEVCRSLDAADVRAGCEDDALARILLERIPVVSTAFRPVELAAFDAVLFAGGGNLNVLWPDITAWRTAIAAAARAGRVPYVVSGQGIGPLSEEIARMLRPFAAGATSFGVRDPLSERALRDASLRNDAVVVGDDALGLRIDERLAWTHLDAAGVPQGRRYLAFQVRDARYTGLDPGALLGSARLADEVAAALGCDVVAVPMSSQGGRPELALYADLLNDMGRRRAPWHVVDSGDEIVIAAAIVKASAGFVGSSFHAALFALEERVPAAVFAVNEYYRAKAQALAGSFGTPVPVGIDPADPPAAVADRLHDLSSRPWSPCVSAARVETWLGEALRRALSYSAAAKSVA